jgi:hypothetical protein
MKISVYISLDNNMIRCDVAQVKANFFPLSLPLISST